MFTDRIGMSDITVQEHGNLLANEMILYHQFLCLSFFLRFVTCWPNTFIFPGKVQELVHVLTELQCMILIYQNLHLFKWMKWFYFWFPLHLIFPETHHWLTIHLHTAKIFSKTDTSIGVFKWKKWFCLIHLILFEAHHSLIILPDPCRNCSGADTSTSSMPVFKWKKWLVHLLHLINPKGSSPLIGNSYVSKKCSGHGVWTSRIAMYHNHNFQVMQSYKWKK